MLAVVLLGALMLGIATLWDGGLPAASVDRATDPAASVDAVTAQDDGPRDQTRPRNDRQQKVVDGELIEPLTVENRDTLRSDARAAEAQVEKVTEKEASFTVASFNVLASQHTEPGGQRAGWPGAGWRSGQTVGLVRAHSADVVGLQEVKSGQLSAIAGGLGYDAWPGGGDPDNSIIWDGGQFELVRGETFQIWFMSRNRPQTIVRLRHKQSRREFYVVNMHTSAGRGGRYASSRNAAFDTLVGVVNRLKADNIPVFVTGDMNDRENFYCRVIPRTGLVASQGGGGTCGSAPRMRPVDWVVGWGRVSFSGYSDDFSSESRRISDHPFVSADARLLPAGG